MSVNYRIFFQNWGFQRVYPEGTLILDILRAENIEILSPCNGRGTCGKCRVKLSGKLEPPTSSEKKHIEPEDLHSGMRLACQTKLQGDISIEIPDLDREKDTAFVLSSGALQLPEPESLYRVTSITEPAILSWEGIKAQLPAGVVPKMDLLRQIPELPRGVGRFWVEIFADKAIAISVTSPGPKYGVAVDIGTTTLAAYLVDLNSGRIIGTASALNLQTAYGADVISRIIHAQNPDGLKLLHDLMLQAINTLIRRLTENNACDPTDILQVILVGNTAMIHLLLKVNPRSLGELPFHPVFRESVRLNPLELGLSIHKEGFVYLLPGIGGFIGSDITAGIIACDLHPDKIQLLLDIGTNGEMVVTGKGRMLACSTAAGPAFEGAKISCGMIAKSGAITDIRLTPGREPLLTTINNEEPRGICGTGLIRTMVEFLKNKIITPTGAFDNDISDPNYDPDQKRYYLLKRPRNSIFISQQDIREFQLAKGAIRAGIEILLQKLEITYADLDTVYLAGAFGTYINPPDAVFLGLLPPLPPARIKSAGNTAGVGAIACLLSHHILESSTALVQRIEHVELATAADFTTVFLEAMLFDVEV